MENFSDPLCKLEYKHGPRVYSIKEPRFTHGKGVYLYSSDGKEYLDFNMGHGVGNIGHSHPKVVKAIQEQAEKLIILHSSFPNEQRARLFEKLASITPKSLTNAFLSNSGSEAVEAALKIAMVNHREIKKPQFITMKRSFHGRTMGALPLTFGAGYREPFEGFFNSQHKFASFGDIESVRNLINENTIGIITEIVQGEGGIYSAPLEFPKQLRELCNEKNITLIFDEVQSGFGRTGKMFAFEHYNICPDILCTAKAIAGGIPMGATIANEDYFNSFRHGEIASTFGGNPLACAAANATIDVIISEKLCENAKIMGDKITEIITPWIDEIPVLKELRGIGLMRGLQFKEKVSMYLKRCNDAQLLLLNAGMTVIRMLPPLIINKIELEKGLNILYNCIKKEETP